MFTDITKWITSYIIYNENFIFLYLFQGELVWFDPGVGHVLPGEVLEYHKPAQVLTVQAVIAGKVSPIP
jgi:hypothetical protein